RALWDLVAQEHPRLDVTLRACRYPHRVRARKQLPSGLFVSQQEPGVCVGAPPKEVRLAETTTVLKGESAEQAVRTSICRAVAALAPGLAGDFVGCHVRTLRRLFFNRPGTLYQTPEALIVHLDPFAGQEALVPVIDEFNEAGHRLPWSEDRRVVMSLTPRGR